MLLLPTETPLTGIEFTRRLPCGKHEKMRRVSDMLVRLIVFNLVVKALRVFFAVRQLYHKLTKQVDDQMPLTPPTNSASCGNLVDLSSSCCVAMVIGYFVIADNYDMLPCAVTIGHRYSIITMASSQYSVQLVYVLVYIIQLLWLHH